MKRLRWYHWVLVAIGLLLLLSIVFTLARPEPMAPRQAERRAVMEQVGPAPELAPPPPADAAWIAGNCIVETLGEERTVAGRAPGRVAIVAVEEGDFVAAGDVLVELAAEAEQAALQAAEAEIEQAQAELSLLEAGTREEEIEAARAEARRARTQAALSQGVYERLEQAADGGGVTEDELERARLQARADRQAAEAADAQLRQAERGPREQEIAEAQARVEAAQARAAQAQAELSARIVEAPIAGEVLEIGRLPGEFYQVGEPLVLLGDTRSLRARMEVDERDLAAVELGADARMWIPDRMVEGAIIEVGHRVRPRQILTEDPGERTDVRVLEVVLDLPGETALVVGQRGVCYAAASGQSPAAAP
jgi:multidrug efflux pump subunit AcrA (membrane-fusion protein)